MWRSLGVIAPSVSEWRTFQAATPLASGAAVFRVTPKNLSVGVIFRTYALVRFKSVQDGETIVTRARRIYPRPDSMVIEAEIPREVRGSGIQWRPEVKKETYRRFIGSSNDGRWSLEIEEFVRVIEGFSELQFDSETTTIDREDLTMDITNAEGID